MKKISLSIALLLVVLISGCDQLEDANLSTPMDVNIEGYIYDGVTKGPIEGAIISGKFGSTKTNSKGYYAINGLDMGQYKFIIEVEGYMAKVITPALVKKEEDFKGNNLNELIETDMYMADQYISTQLLQVSGPVSKPLSGIPYIIELNTTYRDRLIYGTTDANGMLTDTIPDDAFTIVVDTVMANMQYSLVEGVASPQSLAKTYGVSLTDLTITPMFMISTNVVDEDGDEILNFDPAADIMLEFNQAIDIEKSTLSLFKVVNGSYYDVNLIATYSEGNKQVVLSPYDGDLAKGQEYALSISAVATSNEKAIYTQILTFGTYTFEVITSLMTPKVFQLKSPAKVLESTTNLDVQLTIDDRSSDVEVYGRYDAGKEFVKFHTESCDWKDQPNGIIMIYNLNFNNFPFDTYPTAGVFAADNSFELMIRSYVINNGEKIYSDFSEVIIIRKDIEATL